MLIPPKYRLTPRISELLGLIEANREVINSLSIPLEIEQNIRRRSTLKSSLFSAKIEGNPLTLDDLARSGSKNQKKIEVDNILRALNWIRERSRKELTENDILTIHKIVMKGLIDEANRGIFRKNMEAIFNAAGIAVYMPPPPRLIEQLIGKLVRFANNPKERFVPVRAALVHYSFEKIHPFLDGSGRVGRLLLQLILHQGGYGMKGILPLEEYLENKRSEYYRMLDEPEKDATDYVEFILEAVLASSTEAKNLILARREVSPEDLMLPRRSEILRIIKDHKIMNFDQIKRRFMNVNGRTLRYDLKKLQEEGFIQKLGTTRGVYYQAK